MHLFLQILLLVVGFAMLVVGADWFVDGASDVAKKLKIPEIIIGLTIVAMGTSLPEASVSITAALENNADISIGNIVGSNIFNILVILGISAVITKIPVKDSIIKTDTPILIFISLVLLVSGFTGKSVSRIEGIIMWVIFIAYLIYLFISAKKGKSEIKEDETVKDVKAIKIIALLIVGGAMIVIGSRFTVDSATKIAKIAGMSDRFIGLTIVALGTSLPELATSVVASIKKEADIAVGNIVGSNIFNILFVIGTTAIITPVAFQPKFIIDTIISIAAAILIIICSFKNKALSRPAGIIYLLGYAAYFVYLVLV